ncbi:MAG: YcaO-like family protein [Ilumatobacteraceae bacterium]
MTRSIDRPTIFVGPSISRELAERILPDADFRPPIKRGDLDDVPERSVVGIIDGVFADTLAISPGEVRAAIDRGVVIYGAASMGALRAVEVPAVVGVGRIVDMYRTGLIERDDEVALLFEAESGMSLTEPLVNVRYSVERLVRLGTLARASGEALVAAAEKLHYTQRTYINIVGASALADTTDADDLIGLLRRFDLKRDDAQLLLETVASARPRHAERGVGNKSAPVRPQLVTVPANPTPEVVGRAAADAPVLIWESGDTVDFDDLVAFLKMTGRFTSAARRAAVRTSLGRNPPWVAPDALVVSADELGDAAQSLLDLTRLQWGWESSEEAHVTMRDLGLGLEDVSDTLHDEVVTARWIAALARHPTDGVQRALRAELWMDELALKREVLRLGALRYFANLGARDGPPGDGELDESRRCVARLQQVIRWSFIQSDLATLGVDREALDGFVVDLALARRAAQTVVDALDRRSSTEPAAVRSEQWRALELDLVPTPKAAGSRRFGVDTETALQRAERIAGQIGIVRIGLVGELTNLGIHVAQAFGERSGWSASFASGKAETREAAKAGSIMEEVEIHAQDAFRPPLVARRSYREMAFVETPAIDPASLGLPFDTRYTPDTDMDWSECVDLIGARTVAMPTACLVGERLTDDILYSPRLGGKIFSSSGLASGFSMPEAAVHAACECIERHAVRLAELELDNPGEVGLRQFWFVDLDTLPEGPRRITENYRRAGMHVRILDITSEIAVPTFYARVFEDPFAGAASTASDGFAAHPDPQVAVTMALLEAAQTKAGFIAGGREDYSLQARSLGRHERPRTVVPSSQLFWFGNDPPTRPLDDTIGLETADLLHELEWIVDRTQSAGYEHLLIADLTVSTIAPARAVRVTIPGTETTNPLCTGPRGRATCIRDLLPRGRR